MNILDICMIPTTHSNVHESVYRSYHIVQKVKELLQVGTPATVILELIQTMEDAVPGRIPTAHDEQRQEDAP
jgi:hypothetical protein